MARTVATVPRFRAPTTDPGARDTECCTLLKLHAGTGLWRFRSPRRIPPRRPMAAAARSPVLHSARVPGLCPNISIEREELTGTDESSGVDGDGFGSI